MAFTMTKVDLPNKADFDRVFEQALPFVAHERRRMGDDALKAALWQALQHVDSVVYEKDGYVVGMASLDTLNWGGVSYLLHKFPTYGADQTGSRSWWYSDDFQRVSADFVRAEGHVGIVTAFNPNTPASDAVANHFGNVSGDYFERPREVAYGDVFGPQQRTVSDQMKCFVIDLKAD